ncbi:MAG: zinc ribbon domain-containing protein, partial [Dehalococcoidia bacterium]|nr:zinc ribbon domain-containing protein [Dehalococcoidia bacterium]
MMDTFCTKCGTEGTPEDIFCRHCGHKLNTPAAQAFATVACPSCGSANLLGARFCDECGSPIPEDAPGGGRRPAVVGAAFA